MVFFRYLFAQDDYGQRPMFDAFAELLAFSKAITILKTEAGAGVNPPNLRDVRGRVKRGILTFTPASRRELTHAFDQTIRQRDTWAHPHSYTGPVVEDERPGLNDMYTSSATASAFNGTNNQSAFGSRGVHNITTASAGFNNITNIFHSTIGGSDPVQRTANPRTSFINQDGTIGGPEPQTAAPLPANAQAPTPAPTPMAAPVPASSPIPTQRLHPSPLAYRYFGQGISNNAQTGTRSAPTGTGYGLSLIHI